MQKLFGLNFYSKSIEKLVVDLEKEIKNGNKASLFTPNIDHIINNFSDKGVSEIYSQSEYVVADGWPLVATGKLKKKNIERITGVDLMDKLLYLSNIKKYNIYFLGATDETLKKLKSNIQREYPNIVNIGLHDGYFNDDKKIVQDINRNKVNILFVGMGNPKQEIWIRKNFELINSNLILGVGGAFNIFSGDLGRAPLWIQKIGMEWFYRFLKEPKRLFHRYFIKYPKFFKILFEELSNNE